MRFENIFGLSLLFSLLGLLVQLTIVGLIIYVVYHFISKFW